VRAPAGASAACKARIGPRASFAEVPEMKHVYGWLLLTPAAILLIGFTHYPAVATLIDSFFSTGTAVRPSRFVGLGNYASLADDPIFWKVLNNNLWFALGTIPTAITIALVMALWVNDRLPARALVRMAYFTPTVLPMIAVANIWLFFYTPQIGLLDQAGALFGVPSRNWLGDPDSVLASTMVMVVWKEAGFFMIFYLAALQSMPPELEEAAKVEGASRWYYFRRVTFPLLMPTTLFVLVNATINSFKLVDHLFILTKGGPDNASSLLLYYIYQVAFSFFETNYAATLTVVLLALLAALALLQFLLIERRVHYR
jgi:sn-glycerol 3-phosphate transport system permease protein